MDEIGSGRNAMYLVKWKGYELNIGDGKDVKVRRPPYCLRLALCGTNLQLPHRVTGSLPPTSLGQPLSPNGGGSRRLRPWQLRHMHLARRGVDQSWSCRLNPIPLLEEKISIRRADLVLIIERSYPNRGLIISHILHH